MLPRLTIVGRHSQWVSLRIRTADYTKESRELLNVRALDGILKGKLGDKHIAQIVDDFLHEGVNGSHQCLVFELLGPSLAEVLMDYYEARVSGDELVLEPETILRLSKQLLEATAFLHQAGYAHGSMVPF